MSPVRNSCVREALRRGAAACLVLAVFAASGGASLVGRVCTHHGAPAPAQVAQESAGDPHAQHGHGAHAPAEAQQHGEAHDDGACTCLAACQAAAGAAAPASADVVRMAAPAEVDDAAVVIEPVPGASRSSWSLPPSNGPPALT